MFKVTIKNNDENDNWIIFNKLVYRVRTNTSNVDFTWQVCITDDVNVVSCAAYADAWTFSTNVTKTWTPDVALAENDEVSYYILIDGTSIEPDILRAEVSSLSYDIFGWTVKAEKYNVSKMLNE
jgi:hypothetical protein